MSSFSREEVKTQIPRLVKYGIVEPSNGGREYSVTAQMRHCIQGWLSKHDEHRRSIEGKIIRNANKRVERNPEGAIRLTSAAGALLPTVLAVLKLKPETTDDKDAMAELLFKVGSNYINDGKSEKGAEKLNELLAFTKKTESKSEKMKNLAAEATEKLKKAKELPSGPEKSAQNDEQKAKTGKNAKNSRAGYAARELEKMEKLDSKWDNKITVYAADEAARLGLPYTQTLPKGKYKREEDATVTKHDKSTELYRKIHDWYEKSNEAKEEEKIRSKYNLACALDNRRNYKEAEPFYHSSLEFYHNRLRNNADDESRFMYWRVLSNLVNIYAIDRKIEDAEETLEEILDGQVHHLSPNHPETLTTRHNMALILQQKGKYGDANTELRSVLVAQATVLGRENEKTLQTVTSIARNAWLQGDLVEAKKCSRIITQCK